ncbi:MAG: hypothetical protein JWM53_6669 [bacterium]|nr:hypothetical protein [bacterium]
MLTRSIVLLLLSLGVAACGGATVSSVNSCDLRTGTMNLYACRDYDGLDSAGVQAQRANCLDPSIHGGTTGTWSAAPCSHDGSLGGCRTVDSSGTTTLWSYPGAGSSVQNVMNTCAFAMGTYVAP